MELLDNLVLGFGIAIGSWWTLFHDLVTTFLGAVRLIDQRAYEDAMSSPTIFRTILWSLMLAYLVTFVVLFSNGIAAAHRTSRAASASRSSPRAQMHTRHPSATSARALASPRPRLAPVTTAILSVSPRSMR